MRTKISAIIIDPQYRYNDYSAVKYDDGNGYSEKRLELKILENGDDILHEIHRFNGVDAIITIGDESCFGQIQCRINYK